MANLSELLASQKVTALKTEATLATPIKEPRPNRKRPWLQTNEVHTTVPETATPTNESLMSAPARGIRPTEIVHGQVPERTPLAPPAPETSDKVRTNLEQSQNKVGSQPRTNLEQSQNKVGTNDAQENLCVAESQNKVRSQPRTEVRTNLEQSQNKVGTVEPFSIIVGLQRRIILFIFEATKNSREKITQPIAIANLANACETTKMAAQVTIRRLEKKGLIHRAEFKDGRGGWTRYELSIVTFQELLQFESQNKVGSNLEQSQNKVGSQPRTEPRTSPPVVVVSSNYTNTTTTDDPCFVIPPGLSGLVSRKQLSQFVLDGKIGEGELQLSLDSFAYDFKHRLVSSRSSNPVAVLIGAIKNNGAYNSVKYAELLKADLKPTLTAQQTLKESITALKSGEGWVKYQDFQRNDPEAFKRISQKYREQGLPDSMIEEFAFYDFQDGVGEQMLDPLRPVEAK